MPAQIVPGEFCASYWSTYEVRGSKGDTYIVTWRGGEEAPSCHKKEANGDLTVCKAWQFKPWDDKQCKHTQQVWASGCFWNCQWFEGNADVKLRGEVHSPHIIAGAACPNCSGPLVAVRISV